MERDGYIIRKDKKLYERVSEKDEMYQKALNAWVKASHYEGDPRNIMSFAQYGDDVWAYADYTNSGDAADRPHSCEHVFGNGPMWDFDDDSTFTKPYFECDEIIIGGNVSSIGENAYADVSCDKIKIGSSVKEIGDCAFFNGECNVISFPGTISYIGVAILGNDPCEVGKIIISADIKKIKAGAFWWRCDAPHEIVLTGDKPPEDWVMWLRSDLFGDIAYSEIVLPKRTNL